MAPRDRLHRATRAIGSASQPSTALTLALALAADPPPDWATREWLTIAEIAEPRSHNDPRWLAIRVVAYEHWEAPRAPVDALRARAKLIAALGDDPADPFRSLAVFAARAESFVGADTPELALVRYRQSRAAISRVPQGQPEWSQTRDVFLRCRQLRELARVLAILGPSRTQLPLGLIQWTQWSDLREESLDQVEPPRRWPTR